MRILNFYLWGILVCRFTFLWCLQYQDISGINNKIIREWSRVASTYFRKILYRSDTISSLKNLIESTSKSIWNCSFLSENVSLTCAQLLQSYLSFCNPMDWSQPGSLVQEILRQEYGAWVAMPSSRVCSWSRDQPTSPMSPTLLKILYPHWATWEALRMFLIQINSNEFSSLNMLRNFWLFSFFWVTVGNVCYRGVYHFIGF